MCENDKIECLTTFLNITCEEQEGPVLKSICANDVKGYNLRNEKQANRKIFQVVFHPGWKGASSKETGGHSKVCSICL